VLAKLTSKNQLTLPKQIVREFPDARMFEVRAENGSILLTPVRVVRADGVRAKLQELGLTECDVQEAVRWARRKK
jgi:hypothetical protein